jgi:hypothetical protein
MLFGALQKGGNVGLSCVNGEIKFRFDEPGNKVMAHCVGV